MAGATTPDGIIYAVTGDNVTIAASTAALAGSVQTALNNRQRYEYVWANAAARAGQTGMTNGATGYQVDTKSEYIYDSSAWRLKTPYGEWTSGSQSVAATTFVQPTTMTQVTANTTDTTFTTVSGGNVTFVQPGIYFMSWTMQVPGATTTSFVEITSDNAHVNILAVAAYVFDWGQATLLIRIPSANTTVYLWTRLAAAGTISQSALRVGRLG